MPEMIIYYSIEQKILVDIECDRNRNLRIGRRGVRERKNIGKIDDVCGSVNFEDAFTEGGETHFESSRCRPRGERGQEGVNPSVAEHFHIW